MAGRNHTGKLWTVSKVLTRVPQVSEHPTETIVDKWKAAFQLVPPEMHRQNRAERAIRTFKDHFLAILAGVDPAFPPYL